VNRAVAFLLLTFFIQCGIVAIVFWPPESTEIDATGGGLAPFDFGGVDELRIGDEFDNETLLVRSREQWIIPALDNLPADEARVTTLLEQISDNEASWPIARTPSAHQRFQVASHHYQRRLAFLSGGETLGTLYLGTSPGYKKVHARNEKQDAVYSIALSNFDIPATADSWLDPRLLQTKSPLRIDADLYSLYFDNGLWRTGSGAPADGAEVGALITLLKSLQIEGVANEDQARDLATLEPDLILRIQSLTGDKTLELSSLGGQHFIHSSEYTPFFRLRSSDFEHLTGIDIGLVSQEGYNSEISPNNR